MKSSLFIIVEYASNPLFIFLFRICFCKIIYLLSYRFPVLETFQASNRTVSKPGKRFAFLNIILVKANALKISILIIPLVLAFFLPFGKVKAGLNAISLPPGDHRSFRLSPIKKGFKNRRARLIPFTLPPLFLAECKLRPDFDLPIFMPLSLYAIRLICQKVGVELAVAIGIPFAHLALFFPFMEMRFSSEHAVFMPLLMYPIILI